MPQDDKSFFRCPVCGRELIRGGNALVCGNAHSFDLSRRGYVNLLLRSGVSGKRHGDDALMARARTEFLEKGYYDPLADAVCAALQEHVGANRRLLDCGCGEGFYTARAAKALSDCECAGIDVSKAAVHEAAKRGGGIQLAVASAFELPVADDYCGALMNLFAPLAAREFARVLCRGGILVRAVPTVRHLWELKCAVYDEPYENKPADEQIEGFSVVSKQRIEYRLSLDDPRDIDALFKMTPYYYKTSEADQRKAAALERLETQIGFEVLVYKKQ